MIRNDSIKSGLDAARADLKLLKRKLRIVISDSGYLPMKTQRQLAIKSEIIRIKNFINDINDYLKTEEGK